MLTKQAAELLNYLRSSHYETEPKNVPDDIDEIFSDSTASEINEILDYLSESGYIKLKKYKDGGNRINLTHKGLHYEVPLKKGFLSKFSDTIAKHSWLPTLIGNIFVRYFLG
ncbi:MAG: hypothetical protein U0O05_05345 [Dorea phocaeensis]